MGALAWPSTPSVLQPFTPSRFTSSSLWCQPQPAANALEGDQQLVDHPRHPVRARVDPPRLAHELVPIDPGAEELTRPHLARDRLIRDDTDAQPGFHHRLDDLDVLGVHDDGWLDVLGGEEAVDDLS